MLSSSDFVDYILTGGVPVPAARAAAAESALPEGFDGFDESPAPATAPVSPAANASFARRLLEASGFGYSEMVMRDALIRSTDAVARYLPERASYWPAVGRDYQTLLFETTLNHKELLSIPAFKSHKLGHLDLVEDALARLVNEALEGFERGGEGVDSSVRRGKKQKTLCVVSIRDEREAVPVRLLCFGTWNAGPEGGLETFQITEQARFWEPQRAREQLAMFYERQFKKLSATNWQDAFTTSDERVQAKVLLTTCTKPGVDVTEIQTSVLDMLDTIAKGFGLRKKPHAERRLQEFKLPADHDIGIDPEERQTHFDGQNPFGGVTLRDEKSRLLGYIVYPLNAKSDAARLRKHLAANNRFHNVLVVYPDENQASLELWQGREQLTGKLRKGQGYRDAADVVNLLSRFFVVSKAKVKNPGELAQELAYRARYLRRLAVKQLDDERDGGPLRTLYSEFTRALVKDLKEEEFADAFAQTLTYSLLTARWVMSAQTEDAAGDRFTRKSAMKRLSMGSRFLSEMFSAVLAMNEDEHSRLLWLVDDIADLLDRVDVVAVFKPDGTDLTSDPIIHFYEPFLKAYDAKLRMQRGAFYTPRPVVSYIVRSVHELLQTEFGLEDGLAATATWREMLATHPDLKLPPLTDDPGEKRTISADEPFVQILDPATGTGTFLVEVIEVIHGTMTAKWTAQGLSDAQRSTEWNEYVPKHLLPRLHAFELMMAPYAIAHMKIGLKLAETGYHFGTEERARIYLTNALEPWQRQLPLVGFEPLAHEAAAVNEIKRSKRFTVVVGNPPYSGESANKIKAVEEDIRATYQCVDGVPLREKGKKNWLLDDYVKFIRFSHRTIQLAGSGFVGLIVNGAFQDNPTFRGLRRSILRDFSTADVTDLHGSGTRAESDNRAATDENVFDILQGVCVLVLGRRVAHVGIEVVVRRDIWGPRASKYTLLTTAEPGSIVPTYVRPKSDMWYFVSVDLTHEHEWLTYASLPDSMPLNGNGLISAKDHFAYALTAVKLQRDIDVFVDAGLSDQHVANSLQIRDNSMWSLHDGRVRLRRERASAKACQVAYRPFDIRHSLFHRDVIFNLRVPVTQHIVDGDNLVLLVTRMTKGEDWRHCFVTRLISDCAFLSSQTSTNAFAFPLQRKATDAEVFATNNHHTANFSLGFLARWADFFGQPIEESSGNGSLAPVNVLRYAYAVFFSPSFRSRYRPFLTMDFPRIPFIRQQSLFWALARYGGKLMEQHLLEFADCDTTTIAFVGSRGSQEVERVTWLEDTVWLDAAHSVGFHGVPESVWVFHIGGYQVCEKWLKDRKGRVLSDDDIAHYQKIVVAISETIRIMGEIDEVIEAHGGWPGAFVTEATGSAP